MATETIKVPDVGSSDPVDVIEIGVKVGDVIAAEDTIVVLESDKATVEVPAPQGGKVTGVRVKVGDRVREGDPLLEVEAGDGAASGEQSGAGKAGTDNNGAKQDRAHKDAAQEKGNGSTGTPQPGTAEQGATGVARNEKPSGAGMSQQVAEQLAGREAASQPATQQAPAADVHAGPAVRKLAREMGVDLSRVTATGPKGRILKDDVHAWVKQALSQRSAGSAVGTAVQLPEIDFSKFGEVERIELNKVRKVSASNLHRSWVTIPHVTQHDEADITDLENFRQQENKRLAKQDVKLTMLAFMAKACAAALREFPHFNSSLENSGEALIRKHYINIGVAVDTDNGLVVPVLRDVDKKGIVEIAREVGELAEKARNRKLTPKDMQGGSFSISSLGGIGGTAFTPIVNWPEVAILGVSKSQWKPHWNGKEFVPRLMLPLSLSYDHRVIDGADAARFITYLSQTLADMRRALL